jgi:hypothetical protein
VKATFSKVFELQLRHEFYTDGVCRDFEMQPSERTRCWMNGSRWVVKSRPDGFVIARSGTSPTAVHESVVCFLLLRNPEFGYFTKPPHDSILRSTVSPLLIKVFRPPPVEIKSPVVLRSESVAIENSEPGGKPVIRTAPESSESDAAEALALPGLYGIIYLPADSLRISGPVTAKIQFAARRALWVYKCIGRTDVDVSDDRVTGGKPKSLSVKKKTSGSDSIFTSTSAFPCSERPRSNLSLHCLSTKQTRLFPNPPLHSLSGTDPNFELTRVIASASFDSLTVST